MTVKVLTVGCGDSTKTRETSPTTTTATAAPASSRAPGTTAPGAAKVSANTASESEIEASLTGAGVSSLGRAEEVVEYRPCPDGDPNLTKLWENLAKYNPGQETVDKILLALRSPSLRRWC